MTPPHTTSRALLPRGRVVAAIALGLPVGLLAGACGRAAGGERGARSSLTVTEARVVEPVLPDETSAYATVTNSGSTADRLVAATSPVASSVMVHQTTISSDGMTSMSHMAGLDVPAHGALRLAPGSGHLMLVKPSALHRGDQVVLRLRFERAGEVDVRATVVAPEDALR